jgi:hypothetical protein
MKDFQENEGTTKDRALCDEISGEKISKTVQFV